MKGATLYLLTVLAITWRVNSTKQSSFRFVSSITYLVRSIYHSSREGTQIVALDKLSSNLKQFHEQNYTFKPEQ